MSFFLFLFRKPAMLSAVWLIASCTELNAQQSTDPFLAGVLEKSQDTLVRRVLAGHDRFRVQIIYTRIDRDASNKPRFRNYRYNSGDSVYYYPASTVKLPLALLSLEKLNRLHIAGLDKDTRMRYDSSGPGERPLDQDSTAETGRPSIGQFIRKAFLISDNDAYNRMYEWVGQQEINRRLHNMGYSKTRILRQFMPLSEGENRLTNAVIFYDSSGRVVYAQPAQLNRDSFDFSRPAYVGKAYLDRNDSLVRAPMNFTRHNNIPLEDLQQMLQGVMFPESLPPAKRFDLSAADLAFLRRYLSQYPGETSWPKYDSAVFYDSYVKFFFQKGGKKIPSGIRVFNKAGWSYGFLTDVSYVADFKNKIEYMLTCTIYANEDEVLNDDHYDFETVGMPFLYAVGRTIYEYEIKRPRKFRPDLSAFRIKYPVRNSLDKRPSIRDVDN